MGIKNVIAAVLEGDWQSGLDLDPDSQERGSLERGSLGKGSLGKGSLGRSFLALFLTIPCGLIIAHAILRYNANTAQPPNLAISIVLILIALVFPVFATLMARIFRNTENLRAWILIRNWAWFMMMAGFASFAGLYLLGLLPFSLVYFFGLFLYLASLAVDIRLASRVGGLNWLSSVFIAILVSTGVILILLTALGRNLG